MLIVGYSFGIRSERRLCEEGPPQSGVPLVLSLSARRRRPRSAPTFSKNRHGRFRESDLLRKLFETVVGRCMKEGIVGGEAFAVDASIIVADAHRRRGVAKIEDLDPTSNRAVTEYLSVLDDAAFGGATSVEPKTISPTDPAARYTASANAVAGYAYSDNYLVDLKHAVIMDVEATTAIRQAEVSAAKTMLEFRRLNSSTSLRHAWSRMGVGRLGRDGRLAGGRARHRAAREPNRQIRAHGRNFLPASQLHIRYRTRPLCLSRRYGVAKISPRVSPRRARGVAKDGAIRYRAAQYDCDACALKPKCCPNVPARKIARSVHEAARDRARAIAKTECRPGGRRLGRLR